MDEKDFPLSPVYSGSSKYITERVVPASPVENFQVCLGRPDLFAVVQEEVESALGPISVNGKHCFLLHLAQVNKQLTYPICGIASGPLPFTNTVRGICRAGFAGPMAVLRGAPSLTLYTESFGAIRRR